MNVALRSGQRVLLSFTLEELRTCANALNEVCNDTPFADAEFQTRLGVTREEAQSILAAIGRVLDGDPTSPECCDAWADGGAVMVKAITAHGDPVELGEKDAQDFSAKLLSAIGDSK